MADEIIGSVGVEVRADYSDLSADFDKAVSLAVAAGHTLAEAIQMALAVPDATPVSDAFTQVGTAANQAAEQLSLFGAAEESIPFENAQGQLNLFSTELESFNTKISQTPKELEETTTWLDRLSKATASDNEAFQKFAEGVGEWISHPLQSAGSAATNFIEAIGPLGVAALGIGAALAEIGHEALHLVEEFGAAARETQNLAYRLNITWEQARELEDMATLAGVSVTRLQVASTKLATALEDAGGAGKKTAAALEAIGVTGTTSGELLVNFLAKLAEIEDDTERIAAATAVLGGRGAQQIIPLIKRYDELQATLKSLGPTIGTDMAEQLEKAHTSIEALSISWRRFKEQLAIGIGPILSGFIEEMTRAVTGLNLISQGLQEGKLHFSDFAKAAIAAFTGGTVQGAISLGDAMAASGMKIAGATSLIATESQKAAATVSPTVQAIIDKQEQLTAAIATAKAAYDTLNQAYQTGTPLANGYKVTAQDVARALANLTAAEAAAATTTQIHADKTHGHLLALRAIQPAVQALVDQLKQEESAYNKTIQATAAFNSAMQSMSTTTVKALTPLQFAQKQLQDLGKSLDDLIIKAPQLDFYKPFEKIASSGFPEWLAKEVDKDAMAADGAADAYRRLEYGLQQLGIKGEQYYADAVETAQDAYDEILRSGTATDNELAQAAAILALKQIEYARSVGEITKEVYEDLKAAIQKDLDDLDGASTQSANHRISDEERFARQVQQINHRTFDELERGLAHSIVQMKGFADLWKQLWQKLAEDVLQIMFKVLLDPLEKAIGRVLGKISFPGGGTTPSVPGGGGAGGGGAGGGAAAGAGSGALGIANLVTGAITAISSVVGNFQMAHMSSDLQKIEESTRYLKGYTGEQADSLLATDHINRDTLYDILAALDGVVRISLDGKLSNDEANKLVDTLLNGSLNFYNRTYDIFSKLLQATTSGFAQVVGMLHAVEKALNPPLWKSLLLGSGLGPGSLGGAGSAAGGALAGLGSLLGGGLVGGLVSLFTGGGTNWEALIEQNTRYTHILIDQNLPTIAVNSVLHTGQLDAIGVKLGQLDTLAINSVMQTDLLTNIRDVLSGGAKAAENAEPKASASQSVTVHMHQPRIGRLTSASEVSQIFQEGIQQAKEAGAFRFGVFPAV